MEPDPPIETLRNVGPKVAERLRAIGVVRRSELAAIGSVEAYRRMRAQVQPRSLPLRPYLLGLEAALLQLAVSDLPTPRRTALIRAALDLPDDAPRFRVRTRHWIPARRRRR